MQNDPDKKPLPQTSGEADPLAPPELPGISITATPLSRGPLSAVYRGWDRVHHCDVIVKVLQTNGDPVAADRFRREAAIMAQLRHPNIVALYQFHDGNPSALVMEYVPGKTLDALIGAEGWLEPGQAAQIIEEIAAALDCIHAENVVHRDVKPSNILLPKQGPARLTDFGVAHIDTAAPLTVQGDMLGTIEYASPEQVNGTAVPDSRSDVYSLAAVAYFALTGTPPFRAADSSMQAQLSVMHQQVFSEPPPLRSHRAGLSPGIDAAVRRGLAKDPNARYPSAGQLASALRSAVVTASGAPEQVAMAVNTRRSLAWTGALAGAALLVGGGIVVWNHEQSAFVPLPSRPAAMASRPASALPTAVSPPAMPLPIIAASHNPNSSKPKSRPKAALVAAAPALASPAAPRARRIPTPRRVAQALPRPGFLPKHHFAAQAALTRKSAVTERPKYRRHPALVAELKNPAPVAKAIPSIVPSMAWLSVYARQNSPAAGQTASIPAQTVMVDGKPISALASGGWAALPAGKHLIAYVPAGQSGYGRNPGVWVTLAPGAHLTRQILLPVEMSGGLRPASELVASVVPRSITPAPPNAPVAGSPQQVADTSVPATTTSAATPTAVGWYTVSGWIVRNPSAPKPTLVRTSAYWVKVDGNPVLSLAMGQWAELPAGKHTITFQPTSGVGMAVKTWDIDLPPQGHLDQHIPLPPISASPN